MTTYTPQIWHDSPATDTPISAERLGIMEAGIEVATADATAKQPRFMTGTVATASGTAAKTVTLDSPWASVTPAAGDWFQLTYTNGTAVSSATVAINGSTARNVRLANANALSQHHFLAAGGNILYYFDGTVLHMQGSMINTTWSTGASASTIAQRDGNTNLSADAFIPGFTTTATAAGTTTLTVDSTEVQVFTGITTQTVLLPTTGVAAGQRYTIINQSSSGNGVTVQSSGANTILLMQQNAAVTVVALQAAPTAATHWAYLMMPSFNVSIGTASSSIAQRSGSQQLFASNFVPNTSSTVTAAGTTTLTTGSGQVQVFTGTSTQTVVLPTTSVSAGQNFTIINNSTGALTVNASGGTLVATLAAATSVVLAANIATPITNAHWNIVGGTPTVGGGGGVTPSSVDTFTNKNIGDDLDFNAVTAPAAPSSGVRVYSRTGVSGFDAPAWVNNLGVPMVIGRDIGVFCKNISGSTIAKGSAVYIASATTSVVNIAKAQADSGMTKLPCVGITATDITNNNFGLVIQFGVVQNLNTASFGDGASVFVDPTTAGALTATRPTHPDPAQMIGVVINSNTTTGSILACCTQYNSSRDQGINGSSFSIGDGTGSAAKTIAFKNSNTGTLSWQPTANRTLTLPDVTGTLATTTDLNNIVVVAGMLMPCQAVTYQGGTFTISGGSITQIAGTTVNGYSPAVGDRILVVNAPASTGTGTNGTLSNQPANGIYVVTNNTTNLSVTRAADMSGSVNPSGLSVYAEANGGGNTQTVFTVDNPHSAAAFTYGSGAIAFVGTGGSTPTFGTVYSNSGYNMKNSGGYNTKIQPDPTANVAQTLTLPNVVSGTLATVSDHGMWEPVRTHTVGDETFTVAAGSVTQVAGTTVNGQSPAVGDRLLITNAPAATGTGSAFGHSVQPGNGVYRVTNNTTNLTVTRTTDASGTASPIGRKVYSMSGTRWLGQSEFTVSTPASGAFTWGTTAMQFGPSGGLAPTFNGLITAGNGMASWAQVYPANTDLDLGNAGSRWRKVYADGHIPGLTSTVTAAGTTTLTLDSKQTQIFTGPSDQNVVLPTTGVVAGQQFTIINKTGTRTIPIKSSDSTTILALFENGTAVAVAMQATPTAPAHWAVSVAPLAPPSTTARSGQVTSVVRTSSGNIQADAFIPSLTSTATAAGTTTLTDDSTEVQVFTGSTTQTCTLPTTSVAAGQRYTIINKSTGQVNVNSSSGANIANLPQDFVVTCTALQATPTAGAHWQCEITFSGGIAISAVASSVARRDSNANLTADAFIPGLTSTTTTGGTTTLTVDSTEVQAFTGTLDHTVQLPTTGVVAGHKFTIARQSTGNIYINSSGGNYIGAGGGNTEVIALVNTPTTAAHWAMGSALPAGLNAGLGASAYTLAWRNGEANLVADAFIPGLTSTATAAGTTTLTVDSTEVQMFTGSTTQTVTLPTTSILAGQRYTIVNQSSGNITIQSSAGNTITTVGAGSQTFVALQAAPTAAAHWQYQYHPTNTATTGAITNTMAQRNGQANLLADAFIPSLTSTATAAGTTTLTVDSTEVQVFTGSTTQTVTLPTTNIVAGQRITVINKSTGTVTVQTSGANVLGNLFQDHTATYVALQATPTAVAHWAFMSAPGLEVNSGNAIVSIPARDSRGNLFARNHLSLSTVTATAAGTTTLLANSGEIQIFSGTNTQTVVLPTTSVTVGYRQTIDNRSSGVLTVNASGGATLAIVAAGQNLEVMCNVATPTLPVHWSIVGGSWLANNFVSQQSLWGSGYAEPFDRAHGTAYQMSASGLTYFCCFTAPVANTITKLGFLTGTIVSSDLTLAKLGLYTIAANGDMTLVARTASDTTLGNVADTLYQPALNTTGGYPSSYTFIPGQRYALGMIQVGTTVSSVHAVQNGQTISGLPPATARHTWSYTDLNTSYTNAQVVNGFWNTPWLIGIP